MREGSQPHPPISTSFHDLLYGIVAGIALTKFVEFRFWEKNSLASGNIGVWLCLLALYLWGVVKLTLYWLGSRDDMLAVARALPDFTMRLREYLGGVFMAMLLGLMPLSAVLGVENPSLWETRFFSFLGAYTLATGLASILSITYLPARVREIEGVPEQQKDLPFASALVRHLGLTRDVSPYPIIASAACWAAWLLSRRYGAPLAGLCTAAVVIPAVSFAEEFQLWRSRRVYMSRSRRPSVSAGMPPTGKSARSTSVSTP